MKFNLARAWELVSHGRGRIEQHFREDIWNHRARPAHPVKQLARGLARFLYVVAHGLSDNDVSLRASALTFATLLSLIPLLALAFAVAKGLGLQNTIYLDLLGQLTAGRQELAERIVDYVNQTDVKALGTLGLVLLIYSVIKMLGGVEKTFNEIWGVSAGRSFHRKFADYLSVLMIAPVLLIASTGFNATLTSSRLFEQLLAIDVLSIALRLFLRLTPLFAVWVAFTFAYIFIPYIKVKFVPGMIAGIVAGTLWHSAQWGYIKFQVGVARYNAIYGTFASFPIFVVWLQLSWIIVLLGCEVAYAVQHQRNYHPPLPEGQTPIVLLEQAAVAVLLDVFRRFRNGLPAVSADQLAGLVDISPKLMAQVVQRLIDANVIAILNGPEQHLALARDIAGENLADLLVAFRHQGQTQVYAAGTDAPEWTRSVHGRLEQLWRGQEEMTMSNLLQAMDE